jgi:hypothetical protein
MNTNISSSDPTSLAAVPQFPSHDQSGHTVQFYGEDEVLLDEVSRFIGTALGSGDAAIVIATTSHREALTRRLRRPTEMQQNDTFVASRLFHRCHNPSVTEVPKRGPGWFWT